MHGPLLHDIPPSRHHYLDDSVNVITIKVAESDVCFPIDLYGTVLARDGYDHASTYSSVEGMIRNTLLGRFVSIEFLPVVI